MSSNSGKIFLGLRLKCHLEQACGLQVVPAEQPVNAKPDCGHNRYAHQKQVLLKDRCARVIEQCADHRAADPNHRVTDQREPHFPGQPRKRTPAQRLAAGVDGGSDHDQVRDDKEDSLGDLSDLHLLLQAFDLASFLATYHSHILFI